VSNSLAIAAVTATLRNLLIDGFAADADLSDTAFTTQPPDKARTGTTNQLNLFLYQTTPNAAWRNQPMPHVKSGETGLPPLGLDLHYMLTAYGRDDDDVFGHRVLGRGMSIYHDHPLLDRDALRDALTDSDVDAQPERVRITPATISVDEMSRLWTTFPGASYRISAAYIASVVLIESTRPSSAPLPVLTRNPSAQGNLVPPFPALDSIEAPGGQTSARLGDTLTLHGHNLSGDTVVVRFENALWTDPVELAVATPSDTAPTVDLPDAGAAAATWPAGFYGVSVVVTSGGDTRTTNELPLSLAPTIDSISPNPAARDGSGAVTLTVAFAPDLQPRQRAALLLGSSEATLDAVTAPSGSATVTVPSVPAGDQFVRLRIDGVDTLLVDRSVDPPVFDPSQKVTIT
jgi:hypothetical protein